jgi:hypothetical protein
MHIPEHAPAQAEHHGPMPPHERLESRFFALGRKAFYQPGIGSLTRPFRFDPAAKVVQHIGEGQILHGFRPMTTVSER